VAAVLSYHLGCYFEYRLHFKDSARVVPVHVFNGILGLLAASCAEERYVRDVYENICSCQSLDLSHVNFGFGHIFLRQLIGICFIIAWSIATIAPLFLILSAVRSHFVSKVFCIKTVEQHGRLNKLLGNGALLTSPRSGVTDYSTHIQK
jgi:ammonia channel protein AmtB